MAVESAADIVVHDDPVRHQLLNAELPLAMAFALPELQPCRDLVLPASSALSFALVELLDGEGLVCAAHLECFRSLLACWTRCSLMDEAARWKCFDQDARIQFEWMVRQALRLTRPDGTLVLSRGLSGDWCPDLLHAALSQGGSRKDRVLARLILPESTCQEEPSPSAQAAAAVRAFRVGRGLCDAHRLVAQESPVRLPLWGRHVCGPRSPRPGGHSGRATSRRWSPSMVIRWSTGRPGPNCVGSPTKMSTIWNSRSIATTAGRFSARCCWPGPIASCCWPT